MVTINKVLEIFSVLFIGNTKQHWVWNDIMVNNDINIWGS